MTALGTAGIAMAASFPGSQLSPQAKVSLTQARGIALHTVRGTIVAQELEKENGGSGLRYSFDVKTAHGVREVGVDAKTGAVLENSPDNAGGADEAPGGESQEQGGGEADEGGG
ncbi:MAG: PepSY domain-containing protein [Candidatus Eremiobacteraeota bacterium]|nr:PepSY domain-containing protein [Candidatus Eremiobacteraeota bacterium]MBC5804047.1 PepSY domain-containing protein [Candidatus Eremiobacteraeota bacterium]MBC5822232.1 PepSY domain-containing protein [Candidatus Eremiobacteraeota bacterium]